MIEELVKQFAAQTPLDWFVTITAIIYVVLAAKENIWCWVFAIASSSGWAYLNFTVYDLWFDGGLQVFYVVMAVVGIYQWKYGSANAELPITRMRLQQHGIIIGLCLLLGIVFGYFFAAYTPAAQTFLDAITTVFAIVTTFLVIQKKIENWLYWIVIDLVYIYIYLQQGAVLFALIMAIYIPIAVFGYLGWQKKLGKVAESN